jgi:hypothetical protein
VGQSTLEVECSKSRVVLIIKGILPRCKLQASSKLGQGKNVCCVSLDSTEYEVNRMAK